MSVPHYKLVNIRTTIKDKSAMTLSLIQHAWFTVRLGDRGGISHVNGVWIDPMGKTGGMSHLSHDRWASPMTIESGQLENLRQSYVIRLPYVYINARYITGIFTSGLTLVIKFQCPEFMTRSWYYKSTYKTEHDMEINLDLIRDYFGDRMGLGTSSQIIGETSF